MSPMRGGEPAYLIASRQGLYLAGREHCRQLLEGCFFGLACADEYVFAFRHDAPGALRGPLTGRVIQYRWQNDGLVEVAVVAEGLDYNCHQLDFFDGAFFLVDTLHQSIREYRADWTPRAVHQILPPAARDSAGHGHINSIAGTTDTVWVMLHNHHRGLASEILVLDRDFTERGRVPLPCSGCHDIVPLGDGRLLTCLSPRGEIALLPGQAHRIDKLWTRGLVVSDEEVVVGSSWYGNRAARAMLPGFLTFLDPHDFHRTARLYIPAAPTQIRRIERQVPATIPARLSRAR